jgi:hypothetical protein
MGGGERKMDWVTNINFNIIFQQPFWRSRNLDESITVQQKTFLFSEPVDLNIEFVEIIKLNRF